MKLAAIAIAMMIYWPHPGINSTPRIPRAVDYMSLSERQKRRVYGKTKRKMMAIK